ncbi:MAG: 5,6-dimethylbenzimidazole synthase [Pseudomonadota bacterium]
MTPPLFDSAFRDRLEDLFAWRRDVRRFRSDPLPDGSLEHLLDVTDLAPSVGNAQPWRFVLVETPACRAAVRASFIACNKAALASYEGERAALYAQLKLEGLDQAPVQLAVFCEEAPAQGGGLGRATMPETLAYSVVGAIQTLWLAARAEGIGLGWLSILDPGEVTRALDVPESWHFIAYLCLGWPEEEHLDPELVRHGWQERGTSSRERLLRR